MASTLRNVVRCLPRKNVNISVISSIAPQFGVQKRYRSDNPRNQPNNKMMSVPSSSSGNGGNVRWEEPEYGVTDSDQMDPSGVKIAYLHDHVRVEMYNLHKSDPVEWSEEALSKHFGASLTRTRAVLILMKRREELRNELLGTTDGSVPTEWALLYNKHIEDREANTAEALYKELCIDNEVAVPAPTKDAESAPSEGESVEEAAPVTTTVKAKINSVKSVAEVENILKRVEEHYLRQADQEFQNETMEQHLLELAEEGVDVKFRELREGKDMNSITGYSPRLIGDELDEYKLEMQRLRAKIMSQTSAVPTKKAEDVEKELMTYADKAKLAPSDMENKANVTFDHFSRWKFAFKDIAKENKDKVPTMIRTRGGVLRVATPLEDMGRSWYGKKPSFMDKQVLYAKKYHEYHDPDGDEERASKFKQEKKKRVAALKEQMGVE